MKRIIIECPLGMECEKDAVVGDEKVTRRCAWYTKLVGQHPQTGAEIEQWGCAMAMIPVLQVETSNMVRGVQAATESLRNEQVNAGGQVLAGLTRLARTIKPATPLEIESEISDAG